MNLTTEARARRGFLDGIYRIDGMGERISIRSILLILSNCSHFSVYSVPPWLTFGLNIRDPAAGPKQYCTFV
jgi:hypothetical protein